MSDGHEGGCGCGGCACGGVRYRTTGTPKRISACSCHWCRKRTGSVLGLSVYFDAADVAFLKGETRPYRLTSDAGRWIETRFCPTCGTTLGWTLEFLPGLQGIAGGTFDDSALWHPQRYVFARNRPDWLCLSDDIAPYEGMPG